MDATFMPAEDTSVAPDLVVEGVAEAIRILEQAFEAVGLRRITDDNGRVIHSEVRIDNPVLMLADGHEKWPPFPVYVPIDVRDIDATDRRVIEHGAISVQEPVQKDDEDKRGGVRDSGGTT